MNIERNKSLKGLNTFRIGASAERYLRVTEAGSLKELCTGGLIRNEPVLVLGGGSNILFTGDFKGLVIHMDNQGLEFRPAGENAAVVEAGAGVLWNDLAAACVKRGLYGLENLAMIPGRVGAAPVQNIGAYGTEQKQAFEYLEAWDLGQNCSVKLSRDECRFAYRDSVFKNELKGRAIVTKVAYRLSTVPVLNLDYGDIRREMESAGVGEPGLQWVYDAVCRIRQRKLPDTEILGNGGSFFKNPLVDDRQFEAVRALDPAMPVYPTGEEGIYKLSAARLIENCGWKGYRKGDAGVYPGHALILVNYGNAAGEDIWALALDIIGSVKEKFGVELENEVLKV